MKEKKKNNYTFLPLYADVCLSEQKHALSLYSLPALITPSLSLKIKINQVKDTLDCCTAIMTH